MTVLMVFVIQFQVVIFGKHEEQIIVPPIQNSNNFSSRQLLLIILITKNHKKMNASHINYTEQQHIIDKFEENNQKVSKDNFPIFCIKF